MATFFGLLSAGLAIALKDPIADRRPGRSSCGRGPSRVGTASRSAHAGDVIDLRLFQFTLNEIRNWVDADQSTGRIIHINNGRVFSEPLANYDKGFKYIWNEVPVLITHESDWKKAKEILTRIAIKHAEHLTEKAEEDLLAASRQYLINYRKLTPIVYTKVVDAVCSSDALPDRAAKAAGTEHAIWEEVLTEFAAQPKLDLAYIPSVVQAHRRGQSSHLCSPGDCPGTAARLAGVITQSGLAPRASPVVPPWAPSGVKPESIPLRQRSAPLRPLSEA